MRSKKGLAIEALIRIIIAVILLFIAIKVGQKVIDIFAGSDAPKGLESFAEEINGLKRIEEFKSAFIVLDPDMAVIGFSRDAADFRCYGCITDEFSAAGKTIYYTMKKPTYIECKGKPCACVCLGDFSVLPASHGDARELYCRKYYCRSLEIDIAPDVSLQGPLRRSGIDRSSYPYWQNGFMFVRASSPDTPSNGMIPANSERKQAVCIARISREGNPYVAALPLQCAGT